MIMIIIIESNDQRLCFVFRSFWVQVSARRPAILTDVSRCLTQLLQGNYKILP